MRVVWTPLAKSQRRKTALYIYREFGRKSGDVFMDQIHHCAILLADSPYMGHPEPLLSNRTVPYRSIVVNRLNKIVYRIDGDVLTVVALWDTRREPQQQADGVK